MFKNRFGLPLNLQLFAADTGGEGGGTNTGDNNGGDQSSDATKNTNNGQADSNNKPAGSEHMIPKSRFDEINNNYKAVKEQLDALLKEKEEAETKAKEKQGEFESLYQKAKSDAEKFKGEAKAASERVQALEAVINQLVETKLSAIPKEFHDLIPSNMTPEQKLAWIDVAEKKGLFGGKQKEQTPVGEQTNPNNGGKTQDTSKLSPMQKLLAGYGRK